MISLSHLLCLAVPWYIRFFYADGTDVLIDENDLILEFIPGGYTNFSLTLTALDDDDFEGIHSFVIMSSSNSTNNSISGLNALTTVFITDFDGK